jgi:phosphoribosylformylglycinamidine cyclo-ligase
MEIYVNPIDAGQVIAISKSFGVDAQIIGSVRAADENRLTILSEKGQFVY